MIKKIIASVIALLIIIGAIIAINYSPNLVGLKHLQIIAINEYNEEIINDNIITTKSSMKEILEDNYTIELKDGMLIRLESIYTSNTADFFIKIYINEKVSTRGVLNMVVSDNDIVKFVYTATYSYES